MIKVRFFKKVLWVGFASLMVSSSVLYAFDAPQFYRAPGFQALTDCKHKDWMSIISVQGRFGSSKKSYDGQEKSTALFNSEGPFQIAALAKRTPAPTGATAAFITDLDSVPHGAGDFPKNGAPFSFSGSFSERNLVFDLQQNIMLGFFAGINFPLRSLQLADITYSTTISKTDDTYQPLINLIDTYVDPMLAQNAIAPLKTSFNKSGIGDLFLYAGWQGRNDTQGDFVDYIFGSVLAGVSFPTAEVRDINRVFALPLGYNGHYGCNARLNVELGFWKHFAFGASGGATVFLRQLLPRRLKTDLAQNGWILLDKANVLEDHGHIWDIGGYLKAYFKYAAMLVGYSFCEQEPTRLTIADRDNPSGLFKNEIINTDGRLTGWNYQTIHFLVRADFASMTKLWCAPMLEISYDVPWSGKHVFATDMVGGKVGLSLGWDF